MYHVGDTAIVPKPRDISGQGCNPGEDPRGDNIMVMSFILRIFAKITIS